MGFVALFAVAFPIAPIFSFLTNLMQIFLKLKQMTKYDRRDIADEANSIGNWDSVTEFISFIAVPVNLSILIFARNPAAGEIGAL